MAFRVAILGCGTVGGGVARILLEQRAALRERAGREVELAAIVDLYPDLSARRHGIPRSLYAGEGAQLSPERANAEVQRVLDDPGIDLVVEAIGGTGDGIVAITRGALERGKHLVTANKALLAERGEPLIRAARENGKGIAYEAAVCGGSSAFISRAG
jgi:homoserine dehydrogenase